MVCPWVFPYEHDCVNFVSQISFVRAFLCCLSHARMPDPIVSHGLSSHTRHATQATHHADARRVSAVTRLPLRAPHSPRPGEGGAKRLVQKDFFFEEEEKSGLAVPRRPLSTRDRSCSPARRKAAPGPPRRAALLPLGCPSLRAVRRRPLRRLLLHHLTADVVRVGAVCELLGGAPQGRELADETLHL